MSTLTSKDINLERSSTRLHAPPGGQSSIVFGDSDGKVFSSILSTNFLLMLLIE